MKIVKSSFEIMNISNPEPLKFIERIGRTCYKSEDNITETSAEKFVKTIIKNGHEAVIEHVSITVKVICDRGISHEWVRHRVASYAQESTRYCNYNNDKFGNELTFIKPCFWDKNHSEFHRWKWCCETIERKYIGMIKSGVTPQEARSVLPNSLKTELIVTMNLREWRHFLKLRTAKTAHPQMREITTPLLKEYQKILPEVFEDIKMED